MGINNHWRNKQLGQNLLWQELQCLNFVQQHPNIEWRWYGLKGYFFEVCNKLCTTSNQGQGAIIINFPMRVSVNNFIHTISNLIKEDIAVAYLAVNRYEFLPSDSCDFDFPDSLQETMDVIVNKCNPNFRRLYQPNQVDGKHFVGVHGLDVFVYEHNY